MQILQSPETVWVFFHLDKLLQFSLDLVQSSDVLPAHLRHLCTGLSESRGVALTQCPLREGMVGSGKGDIVLWGTNRSQPRKGQSLFVCICVCVCVLGGGGRAGCSRYKYLLPKRVKKLQRKSRNQVIAKNKKQNRCRCVLVSACRVQVPVSVCTCVYICVYLCASTCTLCRDLNVPACVKQGLAAPETLPHW